MRVLPSEPAANVGSMSSLPICLPSGRIAGVGKLSRDQRRQVRATTLDRCAHERHGQGRGLFAG